MYLIIVGGKIVKTEIIAVGTELLLGQIVNTNAAFLSERLASLGCEVYYQTVVGDNMTRLEEVLAIAESRSECIILCGGLGPTDDDLTKKAVAEHLKVQLVIDQKGEQKIRNMFDQRQQIMTPNNLRQAETLEGSKTLQNPNGLAVGSYLAKKNHHYFLLPGPPSELMPMFTETVAPILQEIHPIDQRLYSRVLRFYGIGESQLTTLLEKEMNEQTNPTLAPYAKSNEVTLRLTANAPDESKAAVLLDGLEAQIQAKVGHYFYGYGDDYSLAADVVTQLTKSQKTVTAAESLTAGLFQSTLGEISGASQVFKGGFVTYSAEMKEKLLSIDPKLINQYGVVSQECAEAMATHARKIVDTDFALSFTGVAGPNELEEQAVGTVWIALADREGILDCQKYHFTRDRQAVRDASVMAGLNMLRKKLI